MPRLGSKILVEKLHVSKANVNFDQDFGESEEDKKLVANLKAGNKIVQPFKAKPEGDSFGVYIGRRRFLAKKEAGAKFFVVGDDCLINNVNDEEAEEASWIENFKEFHRGMNPITRAKRLANIVSRCGLREYSRQSGIPASSLSTYLSVLNLSPKMQHLLIKGVLTYTDSVIVARLGLDTKTQDKLAATLMIDGKEAFTRECNLLRKKGLREKQRKKQTKKTKHGDFGKHFWRELTQPLKEFSNHWFEYSKLKEWEDGSSFHLTLEVAVPKDLKETNEPDATETLSADEAPQICSSCGQDIIEGNKFREKEGLYFCGECSDKEPA